MATGKSSPPCTIGEELISYRPILPSDTYDTTTDTTTTTTITRRHKRKAAREEKHV